MKTASFWKKLDDETIKCELCPHNCIIQNNNSGICRVRKNINGKLFTLNYFVASSNNIDPIEKKPLYHFMPGSSVLSLGTYGCNLSCKFCQNYTISKEFSETQLDKENFTKHGVINYIKQNSSSFSSVAYTYNEPTIWAETINEITIEIHNLNIKNVFVTNGFINPKPLDRFLEFADAFNIDLKSITNQFYQKVCGGELAPVLKTIKTVAKRGVHLELTTLIIPGLNDSKEELITLRDWIFDNLGENVPVHLSAYFPTYKLNNPPTPIDTLIMASDILKEKINYVYIGNVGEEQNTFCPKCGEKVIERTGYSTKITALTYLGNCKKCGEKIVVT